MKVRTSYLLVAMLCVGVLGCGNGEKPQTPIKVNDIPPTPKVYSAQEELEKRLTSDDPLVDVEKSLTFITMGLYLYYSHCNEFPTTEEGLDYLVDCPDKFKGVWKGPYSNREKFKDPWNSPFEYELKKSPPFPFQIKSLGPDGVISDDDIIANQLESVIMLGQFDPKQIFGNKEESPQAPPIPMPLQGNGSK